MRCPWCEVAAEPRRDPGGRPPGLSPRVDSGGRPPGLSPRELHAHLGAEHGDQVRTGERNGKVFYQITCPACGEKYEHLMRKAARDPEFIEGFGREIRMVALDMLVHHLMAEHEPAGGSEGSSAREGTAQEAQSAPGQ